MDFFQIFILLAIGCAAGVWIGDNNNRRASKRLARVKAMMREQNSRCGIADYSSRWNELWYEVAPFEKN